jgi:hypothetical protein
MNVVGGFVVTDRILGMFRQKSQAGSPPEETARHE